MHVVSPARYQPRPQRRKVWPYLAIPLILLTLVGAANYLRPLPAAIATVSVKTPGTATPALAWPSYGQQAVAAGGYGLLATNGANTPLATASIAKVILALCVLDKQPLQPGESGPRYTMNAADVTLYETYAAQNGSLLPVAVGETLTEYQMVEALMIPSANNIADSLVVRVFGNQAAYAKYATDFLVRNGLTQTTIGSDASGYDPSTTSTASELTHIGLLALKSPVLMTIAGEKSATFPITGTVTNYNSVLGTNGITGLKTGNNDADPGAFLFTATTSVGDTPISLTGTILGAPDLGTALHDSTQLAASLAQGFETVTLSKRGQAVGAITTAWGQSSPIVTTSSLDLVRWKATPLTEKHTLRAGTLQGEVGSIQVAAGQAKTISTLKLQHDIPGPSFWWRLTRH